MLRSGSILSLVLLAASCAGAARVGTGDAVLDFARRDQALRHEARINSDFAIARLASLTDEPFVAADHYARVVKAAPTDAALAERAVFSVLLVGRVDEALAIARAIPAETLVETELPRLTLALDAFRRGDDTGARAVLKQPWNSQFHALIAHSLDAWMHLDSDPEAAVAFQMRAGGSDDMLGGVAQTLAALMQVRLGKTAQAEADLEALWQARARLAIGVEAHARLLARAGRADAARSRLIEFSNLVGPNPVLSALSTEIEAGTVRAPAPLSARQGVALAIYAATAALASQTESDLPGVYFALALHVDPGLDAATALWADALDKAGRRDEAIDLLRAIPITSLHHTTAQGQLAWALRREGRNDEALAVALRTLEATSDRNIRIQLADLLQSLGRDGESEDLLDQVIRADEADGVYDWRLFLARGAARERLGRWPQAENDLRTALGLNPDNPVIMNYLGFSWIDRGVHLDEGLTLIESALLLSPRSGSITDSLGWAHYKLGNYDRALVYLERATELSPQNGEILDHLGDAYWQVGRHTEAGYQWRRALLYIGDAAQRALIERKLDGGLALLAAASARGASARP